LDRLFPPGRVLGKLEAANAGGSVKDRIALAMIEAAEAEGILRPGMTLVEATSGNTGIGLALVCAVKGYHLVLTMPEDMNEERRSLFSWFGAELVLTPAIEGMSGAVWAAEQLAEKPGHWWTRQFDNPANPQAHYETTGPEIWRPAGGWGWGPAAPCRAPAAISRSKIPACGWWPWSRPAATCGRAAGRVPPPSSAWGPASCPGCWTPASSTTSSPWATRRPTAGPGRRPSRKDSWWGRRPARRWPPPPRWWSGWRTGPSSWPFSPTRAIGTPAC